MGAGGGRCDSALRAISRPRQLGTGRRAALASILFGAWIRKRPRALRYTVSAQHTVQRPTLPGPRQECRPTRRLSPAQPQHSTRLQLGPCVWALSHMSPFGCGQWPERWQQSLRGPTGRLPFPRHLRTLGSSMRQAQSDSHRHGGVARCNRQSSIAAGPLLESATLPRRRRYLSIGRAKYGSRWDCRH